MLSDILEKVADKVYTYKAYPTYADFSDVAEALTRKHPCLREPGSFNKSYGWKQRLKINAEFMLITTVPLETKFLAQLDKHSTKLLEVIRSKGGVVKEKTTTTLQVLDETVDITIRRERILTSLVIYLGEPVEHLIKEYQENEVEELEQTTMAIFITGKEDVLHSPKDIKIVIEGTEVLNELPSVATAFAMVFGLTHST
ncbi:hypothetical protein DPEC_G00038750 [Dallia pectoralis]|uniref:Uncharacterized protein n=1 Tax=Dallia pectoralis TaxID=75939 RepID=A0ACC2HE53_DALPE|nr:hypothetical protein DPEC_G00038750 [Dallia pectoralis]